MKPVFAALAAGAALALTLAATWLVGSPELMMAGLVFSAAAGSAVMEA